MRKRVLLSSARADTSPASAFKERVKRELLDVDLIAPETSEASATPWEDTLRAAIRGADGVVALVSMNTQSDYTQLWTIRCAREANRPILLMDAAAPTDDEPGSRDTGVPGSLDGHRVNGWSWANVSTFIDSLWFSPKRV